MSDEILHVTELFSLDDVSFIKTCYKILLRRDADNSGIRYYMGRLATGHSREGVIYDLVRSKEYDKSHILVGLDKIIKRESIRQTWFFRAFLNRYLEGTKNIVVESREKIAMFPERRISGEKELVQQDNLMINQGLSLNTIEGNFKTDGKIEHYEEFNSENESHILTIKASKKTLKIDDRMVYDRPFFNKILAIKLDHRGDLILFYPALSKLRNKYPKAQIDVLVGSWNKQQLSSWGIADNIIIYDFFKTVSSQSSQLDYKDLMIAMSKTDEYDLAIDFRRDNDTRFVLQNVRSKFTIGYKSHDADIDNSMSICLNYNCLEPGVRVPENYTHMSYQMVKLVDSIPYHHTDFIDINRSTIADVNVLKIGIFPYCGTSFRDWKRNNYEEVIDSLLEKYNNIIIDIYLAVKDDFFYDIYRDHPRVNVLIGLDYNELASSVSKCRVVLSNNSYGGHLAGFLGVPSVIIFSGTEMPQEWRPSFGRSIVIYHDIKCSPCHANNVLQCPYDIACMDISVSDVYEQVRDVIESKQVGLFYGEGWNSFKNRLFSRLLDRSKIEIGKLREIHVAYSNNQRSDELFFDVVIAGFWGDNSLPANNIDNLKALYVTVKSDGNVFDVLSGGLVSYATIENSMVFVVIKDAKDIANYSKFIRVVSERNCTVIVIIDDYVSEALKRNNDLLSAIGCSLSFSDHVICADNEIDLLHDAIEYGVQNAGDICSVNLHARSFSGDKLAEVFETFYPSNKSCGYINIITEDGTKKFFWFDRRIHIDKGSRISKNKIVATGRGRDNSIWGPYIELSAGIYHIDVFFVIHPECKNLLVRACSMESEEYYAEAFFANPQEGEFQISIPFCIVNDVNKFELLFSASEGSIFSLVKYTINKNEGYGKLSGDQDMLSTFPTRKVHSFYGSGSGYFSEVGKNDSYGNLVSSKKRGCLLYGQSITLKAGRYVAKIYATAECLSGNEFITVNSNHGSIKIIEHAPLKGASGELCKTIEFVLTSKHEDVEFVVYIDNSTNITISRVSICEY